MDIYIIVTDDSFGTNIHSFLDKDEADAFATEYMILNCPEMKDMVFADVDAALIHHNSQDYNDFLAYETHHHPQL